ncbi:hypothetical protein J437_LFUL010437, partial [Ladona fulva]
NSKEGGGIHGGWSYGKGKQIINFTIALDLAIANTYLQKNEKQLVIFRMRNDKVINRESVAVQHMLMVADFKILVRERPNPANQREQRIK